MSSLQVCRTWFVSPALWDGTVLVGWGSGHVANVMDTTQGVCHTPLTQGQAGVQLALQFQARGPGGTFLSSKQWPDTFLPDLWLFSKPLRIILFCSFRMLS